MAVATAQRTQVAPRPSQVSSGARAAITIADDPSRDIVVREHLGLVYHIARQLHRAKAMPLELDELVSAGTLGLIEALQNFDASRGLAFSTFAAPRIRGAMLDEMRRHDNVPRSVRRRSRDVAAVTDSLQRELGHTPAAQAIAKRLGVDLATFFRWQCDSEGARVVSLERSVDGPVAGAAPRIAPEALLISADQEADERLTHAQEVARLRLALSGLPEQERTVLALYYFEGLKLLDIATTMGVSESRVSQIRSKAIARLRRVLGSLREACA